MTLLKAQYRKSAKPWTPDEPQHVAVKYLIEHAAAGLLLDPGFGKTAVTLAAFAYLKEQGVANRMLILAPARVMHLVWPAEVAKWKDFSHLTIKVIHGAKKEEDLWASLDADIIVTNFESLKWLLDIETTPHKNNSSKKSVKVNKRRFKKLGFDTLVIDELSKFKHSGSIRYKTLKQVVHMFSRRWGLTGSPAANGLMGLFAQCYILDEGNALGRFVTHFKRLYFDKDDYGYGVTLKEGADKLIQDKIAPLMLRIDEVESKIKLPKMQPRNLYVDLPPKARKVYTDLESDLLSRVDEKLITAANSATATMKCRQITSGGVYTDPDIKDLLNRHKVKTPAKKVRESIHLHDAKTDALAELIQELNGKPALIAYDFKHDLERIANMKIDGKLRYPKGVPYIGGGTTPAQAKELEQQWLNGEISELYGHPQSIAHGLNLQHWGDDFPRHIIWYSLTWDYELYDQLNRRIRRRGNMASRVFIHHIIARDTIDEYILGVLYAKKRVQNALFKALKELREARFNLAA